MVIMARNQLSVSCMQELLRAYRENNERKSKEVVKMWENGLKVNSDKLGKEKHLILEQVCIAALDCYELSVVEDCISMLYEDFPNSLRVRKYEAMCYEANEQYDKALKILDSIIKVDETNSSARKRRVTILKAQGRNPEAIKELTDYLKIFMADTEAWQELSDLYIAEQDYNKAAFCVEELILHSPHNHLLHQRYADIRYTQGGIENLELAKAYYTQALQMNDKNVRAMYGLYMATTTLAISPKYSAQKKKEALKASECAISMLKRHYDNCGDIELNIEDRLSSLSLN